MVLEIWSGENGAAAEDEAERSYRRRLNFSVLAAVANKC